MLLDNEGPAQLGTNDEAMLQSHDSRTSDAESE